MPSAPDSATQASEVSAEREEQLHQALIRLALPCIFTASMEQRHSLVLSLLRQLSVFLQLCERYERGQLAARPPTAVAQKHLVLRLRLLVPLMPTVLKQKGMCKHEDLVLTLFRLLGKRLVQAGEADATAQWFVHLLDALIHGRDFESTRLAPGGENRLLTRLREELRRMELPPAWRRLIVTALPFLLLAPPSFDFVVPTARLSQPPAAAVEAGAESRDVHLDPWRLLEDYNDTPFALALFGGTRIERVSLTYAQMRPAPSPADAPAQQAQPQGPKRAASEAPGGDAAAAAAAPVAGTGDDDMIMADRPVSAPQAKVARV